MTCTGAGREREYQHRQRASALGPHPAASQSLGLALCGILLAKNPVSSTLVIPLAMPRPGWSWDGAGLPWHRRQEEETSWSSSAQGQTLSPQGGQTSWCLCNTLKANTGPSRASADESWAGRGRIQLAASRRSQAALGMAQHGGKEAARSQHRAPCSIPGKTEPLCPIPSPFPGRARGMPPGPVMSRQEGHCFGGSWVSGSTCPALGPSTMTAFLCDCCRAANYPRC